MFESAGNFAQNFLAARLGEAELIVGLVVGVLLIADFLRAGHHGRPDIGKVESRLHR
jgi:hypothetical protein